MAFAIRTGPKYVSRLRRLSSTTRGRQALRRRGFGAPQIPGPARFGPGRRRTLSRSKRGRAYLRRQGYGDSGPPQSAVGSYAPTQPIGPAGRTARVSSPIQRRQAPTLDLAHAEKADGFPGAPY